MNSFPSDKILKRMGYFNDQEGIIRRYIDEEFNWNEHLQKSKSFIKKCIEEVKPQNVAVLGSGWLLDVPLDFLVESCNRVFLFDIRHPRQITHKYRGEKKIKFINQDVTGGSIEEVYEILKHNKSDLNKLDTITKAGFTASEPIDYIISVNILNQLDILILEYIRRFSLPENLNMDRLRKIIQEAHIASLKKSASCLITDFEEMIYDKDNELIKTNSLLFTELPAYRKREDWIWKFDTQMTFYPNRRTFLKVLAMQI